jgi:IS30 family transposase
MTIQVLHERGVSNRAIGRQLGVDERTVRYRLQRAAEDRPDGRSEKVFRAEAVAGVIARFVEDAQSQGRGRG